MLTITTPMTYDADYRIFKAPSRIHAQQPQLNRGGSAQDYNTRAVTGRRSYRGRDFRFRSSFPAGREEMDAGI